MTKNNFLIALQDRLSSLPQDDVKDRLTFYCEMIDDRMEEGLTEEDAVSAVGSVDEIAAQITADIPPVTITKEKKKPARSPKVWEIVLLALGSPLWIPLLTAALAVIFSLYVSLWSVIISLWAIFVSFVGCSFAGIVAGVGFLFVNILTGIAIIGGGLFAQDFLFSCSADAKLQQKAL